MRTAVYRTVFTLFAASLPLVTACSREPEKPSLVLIVMEGVRADHTSLLGYPKQTTPGLEGLQHEGVVFENAYSSTPSTPAALASLITGRYPPEHGSFLKIGLDESVITMAEVMKNNGYQTHAVSSDPTYTENSGFFQGFETVEPVDGNDVEELDGGAEAVSRAAISWLSEKRDTSKPFFLMLVYSSTLLPFDPPEPYVGQFQELGEDQDRIETNSQFWVPFARRYNEGELDLSSKDIRIISALYDGEIAHADHQVTQVISHLRSESLLDNLLLVITSERGEVLGEVHKLADPSSLRESNLRVPLLMRFPPKLASGETRSGLIQDVDLLPSVCDLLGLPAPSTVSRAAYSQFGEQDREPREEAVSVALKPMPQGEIQLWMSIRDATHRYEISPAGPVSLYDLESDSTGNLNILAEQQAVAERLHTALGEWDGSLTPLPGKAGAAAQGGGQEPKPAPAGEPVSP